MGHTEEGEHRPIRATSELSLASSALQLSPKNGIADCTTSCISYSLCVWTDVGMERLKRGEAHKQPSLGGCSKTPRGEQWPTTLKEPMHPNWPFQKSNVFLRLTRCLPTLQYSIMCHKGETGTRAVAPPSGCQTALAAAAATSWPRWFSYPCAVRRSQRGQFKPQTR